MRTLLLSVCLIGSMYINGQTAEGLLKKADQMWDLQDWRGAEKAYSEAINLQPNNWRNYFNRARVRINLNNYIGAIEDLNYVLEIEPTAQYMAYETRGDAKEFLQDYRGAISDYTNAINMIPNSRLYTKRGMARIKIGKKEEGCLDLSKAGELGATFIYPEIKRLCN